MNSLFQVLANTADGALVVDENQYIVFWNQAAQKILGYTLAEVVGRPCHEVLKGCNEKGEMVCCNHCRITNTVFAGKTVTNYDLATFTKSGTMRWINVSILAAPPGDDAALPLIVHLFRDANQTKLHEQLVQQMFDTAERQQQITPPAPSPGPAQSGAEKLTNREHEVLSLLTKGVNTNDIAQSLSISSVTVRNHIQHILHKLHVHSRLEAVAYAFEHNLVDNSGRDHEHKTS